MKPSERRAIKELKAQKMAEEPHSAQEHGSGEPEINKDKPKKIKREKSILDNDVESMRKEGFFQSHVKLITFIICMVVFLSAATVIPLVHWLDERTVVRGDTPMTLEDVIAISSKKQYISWDDLEDYIHVDQSHGQTREYMFSVADTTYVLMATGPKSDKKYPDSVLLCDVENTSYVIDLTVDNIQQYLAGASKTPTKYIRLADVQELSKNAVYLKWSDFADFKYSEKREAAPDKQSMITIRIYPMEDAEFSVWVYGEKIFGEPQKVILVDDNNSKNFVDITNIKETQTFIDENIIQK